MMVALAGVSADLVQAAAMERSGNFPAVDLGNQFIPQAQTGLIDDCGNCHPCGPVDVTASGNFYRYDSTTHRLLRTEQVSAMSEDWGVWLQGVNTMSGPMSDYCLEFCVDDMTHAATCLAPGAARRAIGRGEPENLGADGSRQGVER